jgi:hypothetical protein
MRPRTSLPPLWAAGASAAASASAPPAIAQQGGIPLTAAGAAMAQAKSASSSASRPKLAFLAVVATADRLAKHRLAVESPRARAP